MKGCDCFDQYSAYMWPCLENTENQIKKKKTSIKQHLRSRIKPSFEIPSPYMHYQKQPLMYVRADAVGAQVPTPSL